jgi:hypothetical protein
MLSMASSGTRGTSSSTGIPSTATIANAITKASTMSSSSRLSARPMSRLNVEDGLYLLAVPRLVLHLIGWQAALSAVDRPL